MPQYKPGDIEKKWQEVWEKENVYQPDMEKSFDAAQDKPFYNLMMFPYPSAEGMHIGNMYAFTGADIYGRFKRMQGFSVFEPIGLDGFGIHSENYALKVGKHPKEMAQITAKNFYRQLRATGNSYAFKHTLETYDPDYYKWTQWIFITMFKQGLAYRKEAPVNYCPSCKTVLADEQVIQNNIKTKEHKNKNKKVEIRSGECERCGSEVEVKNLSQWFFKITDYAERLLGNIKKLNWPQRVLLGQKNWIGKSQGAEIIFKIDRRDIPITVFTTRLDTIYGVTALLLAPDKKGAGGKTALSLEIASDSQKALVEKYIKKIQNSKFKTQNSDNGEDKTGVFTGAYAVNPFSGEKVPVWVANYVVGWYGTGALMVVPAHDERDFEFCRKYKIPIRPVVKVKNRLKGLVLTGSVKEGFTDGFKANKFITSINKKGNYQIDLTSIQIDPFISFIKKYLKSNYWVELVGSETIFIFGDGDVKYIKSAQDEEEVLKKCKSLEKSITDLSDIWEMFATVDWYLDTVFTNEYGTLINSAEFNGLESHEAIEKMVKYLEDTQSGGKKTQYKLRDWIISRQRYWGAPIPMIYCETCAKNGLSWFTSEQVKNQAENQKVIRNLELEIRNFMPSMAGWYPVPESQLPVLLPEVTDWKPKGTGHSPLASVDEFVNVNCPGCGSPAVRETDVCDTFLDSAWYFLRYPSTRCARSGQVPFDSEITKRWLPISQYIGGAEHTVLHLLYSRFVSMVLHDGGFIDWDEPFPNFYAHGMIIKDGAKMSKSRGNVVIPDEYIRKFGADTLRCYLMFLGPFDAGGDFRDEGMRGMYKFLTRVWKIFQNKEKLSKSNSDTRIALHKTISKAINNISKFKYNTTQSTFMEFMNVWETDGNSLSESEALDFLKLIAPFAPHLTEEIYQTVFNKDKKYQSIHLSAWPVFDEKLLVETETEVVVQVNGKLRASILVPSDKASDREYVVEAALANDRVKQYVKDRLQTKKIIFVSGKLVNFVV